MKRFFLIIIPALISGMILASCSDDDSTNANIIDGTYVGSYTYTNLFRDFSWTTTPTIELRNGKYSYKDLLEGPYYTNGSGNYSISNNKIIFELEDYDIPMEDIGVVEELLLQGEYYYQFDGNKLIFSKNVFPLNSEEEYSCEFELYKQ